MSEPEGSSRWTTTGLCGWWRPPSARKENLSSSSCEILHWTTEKDLQTDTVCGQAGPELLSAEYTGK